AASRERRANRSVSDSGTEVTGLPPYFVSAAHAAPPTRLAMDRDLVVRARGGDRDAFARLAAAAITNLDAVARMITRDPERAKDAVQEALARAWRDLPGLRDPDRFDAWLRRLLVRACIDEFRRARSRVIEVELTELHHPRVAD